MRRRMLHTVVPGLVSVDVGNLSARGTYLLSNLRFFPPVADRLPFHYCVKLSSDLAAPKEFDFRNAYYSRLDDTWFYERRLARGLAARFEYNETTRTFTFNPAYWRLPLEIGGIWPPPRHLADTIALDLFRAGFDVVRGMAYSLDARVTCCIAPSFNGKTALIGTVVARGGSYIAEETLILDHRTREVYPTGAAHWNYGRKTNRSASEAIAAAGQDAVQVGKQQIDRLIFFANHTSTSGAARLGAADCFLLNAPVFISNTFAKSRIAADNTAVWLADEIGRRASVWAGDHQVLQVANYDFSEILGM